MAFIGIDIGTTGSKCSLYEMDGRFLREIYDEYESTMKTNEQLDATFLFRFILNQLKRCITKDDRIEAISVTSFGEAFLLLDENGHPLFPSLLYTGKKGEKELQTFVESVGEKEIGKSTGLKPSSTYSLAKLLYLQVEHPAIIRKAKHFHLFADYLTFCLSGVHAMDYSLASRTLLFDIHHCAWNKDFIQKANLPFSLFPTPYEAGTVLGDLLPEIAQELHLVSTCKIVLGCHDQIACSIGSGCFQKGMAVNGSGTVECITPVFSTYHAQKMLDHHFAVVPFFSAYVTYAYAFTGGAILKWYRDHLAKEESEQWVLAHKNPYDVYQSRVQDTPSGLLVLPYFSGAATPYMDSDIRGAIVGLDLNTTKHDIYQAILEGITFESRFAFDCLRDAGIEVDTIRVTGGGALSEKWLQMKADILNKPVQSLHQAQTGTVGCILLCLKALKKITDFSEALPAFLQLGKVFYPRSEIHALYEPYYQRYKKMYALIKQI